MKRLHISICRDTEARKVITIATEGRAPRDRAYVLWLKAGGSKAPKGTLIKIAKELNVTDGTIRKWKLCDEWESLEKTGSNVLIKKKNGTEQKTKNERKNGTERKELSQKDKAKEMYLYGVPNKEICQETGVKPETLSTWVTRYSWLKERENIYIKIQDEMYKKLIDQRKEEINKTYTYVGIIRDMTMAKVLGQEIDKETQQYKKQLRGKELAAEMSALNTALKTIEDSLKIQNRLLGIPDGETLGTSITREFEIQLRADLERQKIIVEKTKVTGDADNQNEIMEYLDKFKSQLEKDKKQWQQSTMK
ncbi:MAG: phage terminase small subunit-related protein [Fusobacterium sp.]|uniref:phage terminase small subunit-related protein n=1 Tax=Fusobacterium sp. TaxID=68766 RepID=UPI003991F280